MRSALLGVGAVLLSAVLLAAQAPATSAPAEPPPQVDKPFAAGGSIYMDLSAGGYVVEGIADARIRLRWTTRDPADARAVHASVQANGAEGRVVIDGPSNGFHVRIEVPVRSSVNISLSAGDLSVGPLDGDVDVSAWAGNMQVAVRNPQDYYSVRASVTAGKIDAEPFGASKGGLFRSITHEGKGRRSLRVRLTAGDIVLRKADADSGSRHP